MPGVCPHRRESKPLPLPEMIYSRPTTHAALRSTLLKLRFRLGILDEHVERCGRNARLFGVGKVGFSPLPLKKWPEKQFNCCFEDSYLLHYQHAYFFLHGVSHLFGYLE